MKPQAKILVLSQGEVPLYDLQDTVALLLRKVAEVKFQNRITRCRPLLLNR